MEKQELMELKREINKEFDQLQQDYKSFKRRTSVIANLFLPGIGFILYGSSILKGVISFILFAAYNFLFFYKILPITDIGFVYYIPAIAIWIVSAIMVAGLGD